MTVRRRRRAYVTAPTARSGTDDRALYSHLPSGLALRLTCRTVAALVRGDDGLVAAVVVACRAEAERAERPDPAERGGLLPPPGGLDRQITVLLSNGGDTGGGPTRGRRGPRSDRRERDEVRLADQPPRGGRGRPAAVPTRAEVLALLDELGAVLESAAAGDPAGGRRARRSSRR